MPVRPSLRVAAAAGLALAAAAAAASPASAATVAPAYLDVAAASATLSNPNSQAVITLTPTRLFIGLGNAPKGSPDNAVFGVSNGNLPLAPVQASFKAYGFLPARGTVVFTQVKPITGLVNAVDGDLAVQNTVASYVISLRNVVIGGKKADVGTNCQTVKPIVATVASDPGYSVFEGGGLSGTFDLGTFQNCGAASFLINDTLPGTGNTLSLTVGGVNFVD